MDGIDPGLLSILEEVLSRADIKLNGTRPWDLKILNPAIFDRVIQEGSVGFGEGYMDGWWDCEDLHGFAYRINKHKLYNLQPKTLKDVINMVTSRIFNPQKKAIPIRISDIIKVLSIKFFNHQTKELATKNVEHYNLGDDLFTRMLGPHMQYSCCYWKDATTLEEAEENKLRLVSEKLHLKPGMRVLEIGCGWGALCKYMAKNYGVSVVGVTVSSDQQKYGEKLCEGLNATILLKDYRDVEGKFDRIVSIEMFEHVGPKNYDTYFSTVDRCLAKDGLFLLHTTGSNEEIDRDEWYDKYFYPNLVVPTLTQIASASEPYFVVEDLHNIGAEFYKTSMAWLERFLDAWPHISHNYDERFKRMFVFFLNFNASCFSSRRIQSWQIVFSRGNEGGVYVPR